MEHTISLAPDREPAVITIKTKDMLLIIKFNDQTQVEFVKGNQEEIQFICPDKL